MHDQKAVSVSVDEERKETRQHFNLTPHHYHFPPSLTRTEVVHIDFLLRHRGTRNTTIRSGPKGEARYGSEAAFSVDQGIVGGAPMNAELLKPSSCLIVPLRRGHSL